MEIEVKWSKQADLDYAAAITWLITIGAKKAAIKLDEEVFSRTNMLKKFPSIGKATEERDVRKIVVTKNHSFTYKIYTEYIVITAFIDNRSDNT